MKLYKNNMYPKNILYIIDDLDIGGTEQQLYELIKNIDKSRFKPVVCVINKMGIVARRIEKLGIKVLFKKKRFKFDFLIIFYIIHVIRRYNIDIVQTFLFTSNTWARIAAILADTKYIISSERNVDVWKKNFHFFIDKILSCFTDAVIVNASAIKDFIIRNKAICSKYPINRIFVIWNGSTIERLETQQDDLSINFPQKLIVGTVGRLERAKGHINIIKCAQQMEKYNCIFVIVGDGSLKEYLKNEIKKKQLLRTVFITGQSKFPIEWLKKMDIFILPSLWEGCPNAIIEAMMVGLPIIASDVGGIKEMVDNKSGFLIPANDVNSLVKKLTILIENEKLRKSMGNHAQKRALQLFDISKMVSIYENTYTEIIKGGINNNIKI